MRRASRERETLGAPVSDLTIVILFGVMQGGVYAAVALGLVLVFGVTDIVNFAHGEIVTLGAFGIILLSPALGFPVALLVTLVAVGIFSALMYQGFKFTIGNHLQALVLSLGVLLVIQSVMMRQFGTTPRRGPSVDGYLTLFDGARIAWSRVLVLVALIALVAAFAYALKRSWIGVALRACGDDQLASATIGLSARRVGLYAFVASGVLAAAAGVAIAAIYPVTAMTGAEFLLKGFAVVILGGLGSVSGAFAAAMVLGLLESFGATYIDPSLTHVFGFGLMIVVLLVAPQGLFNRKVVRAG